MTKITGMNIVFLYTSDMSRALAFYRDLLGLDFALDGDDWAETRLADGMRFALHRGTPQVPGTAIVDFATDDLDGLRATLERAGVGLGREQEAPTGRFFDVRDPDGYRIQFIEPRA